MNQIISGNSLAKICDHIFSQTAVAPMERSGYRITKNMDVIGKIKSGQSVFVKTDYLFDFFSMIREREDLKNVRLITHDSDKIIDQHVIDNMPDCINKMLSINVCVVDDRVIPIPIGIANDYCGITLKPREQKSLSVNGTRALIACNIRNNPSERSPLYSNKFDNDVTVIDGQISLTEYEILLQQHDFIFCPEGNGPDTHRLWETLYMGKIPIVKSALWNRNFRDLPIMFVDSFINATKGAREKYLIALETSRINSSKLGVRYWQNLMTGDV